MLRPYVPEGKVSGDLMAFNYLASSLRVETLSFGEAADFNLQVV